MAAAAFRIEHRIGIPAPANVVWQVLSDLQGWARWNPLYRDVRGELHIGDVWRMTVLAPGEPPEPIAATLVDWVPDAQLLLETKSRGFIRRVRYLEIEKLDEESSIFSNGEDWWGRFARYVPARRRRALRAGFQAMSEALSAEALERWTRQRQATTSGAG
jgi:hypothetical protein